MLSGRTWRDNVLVRLQLFLQALHQNLKKVGATFSQSKKSQSIFTEVTDHETNNKQTLYTMQSIQFYEVELLF